MAEHITQPGNTRALPIRHGRMTGQGGSEVNPIFLHARRPQKRGGEAAMRPGEQPVAVVCFGFRDEDHQVGLSRAARRHARMKATRIERRFAEPPRGECGEIGRPARPVATRAGCGGRWRRRDFGCRSGARCVAGGRPRPLQRGKPCRSVIGIIMVHTRIPPPVERGGNAGCQRRIRCALCHAVSLDLPHVSNQACRRENDSLGKVRPA